ncbi:hypothetical protein LguiA_001904 [Lonicera macranthoides]
MGQRPSQLRYINAEGELPNLLLELAQLNAATAPAPAPVPEKKRSGILFSSKDSCFSFIWGRKQADKAELEDELPDMQISSPKMVNELAQLNAATAPEKKRSGILFFLKGGCFRFLWGRERADKAELEVDIKISCPKMTEDPLSNRPIEKLRLSPPSNKPMSPPPSDSQEQRIPKWSLGLNNHQGWGWGSGSGPAVGWLQLCHFIK